MSRKSRERMMHGAAPGRIIHGAPSPFAGVPRAKLMKIMRNASASDREGIRQHLRNDGSTKALALLEELERQWKL